ncbi:MAG: oxidoreductase, partial [SAR86 cluster bacterium]|nr:oxidoreductase [SAR86 cluster bacterium]
MAKTLLIGSNSAIALALKENSDREFISLSRSEGTLDLGGDLNELDSIADIDGLVYFPGTINLKPFAMLKEDDFVNDFSVNVLGAVKVLKKVINQLKEAD